MRNMNKQSRWQHFSRITGHLSTIAGLAVVIAFFGCASEEIEDRPVRPVIVWEIPDWMDTERVRYGGLTKSRHEVRLSFRVSGEVEELAVHSGQSLSKGDLVARLDPTDYELEVQRMQSELTRVRAKLTRAEADYQRTRALYESDNVSRSVLDRDRAMFESARGEAEAAEKALALSRQQLDYTVLRAPSDGTVSRVPVEQFQTVEAGTPVVTMTTGDRLRFESGVSEVVVDRLKQGMTAEVILDRFPERIFPARLVEVGVEPTRVATYPVTAELEEEESALRPGMAGELHLQLPLEGDSLLVVPAMAVAMTGSDQPFVWVVDLDTRKVHRQEVKTRSLRGDGLEIIEGLKPGQWVVVRGIRFMEEGLEVNVRFELNGERS